MKSVSLLLLSFVTCLCASAQPEKIPLWKDLAPGTENRANNEVVSETGNISQVYQPELFYYPAPDQSGPSPAIIVCPGGGYRNLVMPKEGARVAQWFNKHGFAVFILKYRLSVAEAVQDARRAVRFVRENSQKYRIDPAKIGITGFSAGGHLCANLAMHHDVSDIADATDKVSARPDFCAPIYGVFDKINRPPPAPSTPADFNSLGEGQIKDTIPPMFLAHAVDDKTVPVEHSLNLFIALKAHGVPVELHLYEKGGHGFSLDPARGYASSWGDAFILWLKAHGIEGRLPQKS